MSTHTSFLPTARSRAHRARAWTCAALLALAAGTASARTFEVEPGGALPTPAAALQAVRDWRAAGHPLEQARIRIASGTYELAEPLALTAADHDLLIEARRGGRVMLSGGTIMDGWTKGTDGLWRITLPEGLAVPEQLYAGDQRAQRAREPDGDFFALVTVAQQTNATGSELALGLPAEAAALLPAAGATIQVFHKWDTTRGYIAGFDASTRVAVLRGATVKPWNKIEPGRRFIIENAPAACDEDGEWYSEGRTLVLRTKKPAALVAPRLERLVGLRGASNVTFRGLRLAHTAYRMPERGDGPAQAASFVEAAVHADEVSGITFEDCAVEHTGNYAVWFVRGCRDSVLRRCVFRDLGAGGVRIGEMRIAEKLSDWTGGITVEACLVETIGRVHPSAVGIWIGQSANNVVRGCEIRDTFYSGFSLGWTWGYGRSLATNNLITGNYVHQIGQGALCDMGGIYTLGISPGTRITGNYFSDIEGWEYGGWGLYTDEGSTGIEMTSNVVVRTSCRKRPAGGGGFHQHYGATNLVAYNFLADAGGPQVQATRVENHLSFTLRENTIVNGAAPALGGTWNPVGPWDKIQVRSEGNRFFCGVTNGYAGKTFAAWQAVVKDSGSTALERAPATPKPPRLRVGPGWL